jgi:hypothetical protein
VLLDVVDTVPDVVVDGSAVTVPITQYALLTSRSGQVRPGFSFSKPSMVSPKARTMESHVAPLPGVI